MFVDRGAVQPSDKGALTQVYLGGVTFELVVQSSAAMNLDHFGMDTITLAGPLEAQAAGDPRGRLHAGDAQRHRHRRPSRRRGGGDRGGPRRAACASPASRCCATSKACRATCTPTRSISRKAMLEMCHALGSRVLLVCSSTSAHAGGDTEHLEQDLQKLAMLAVPLDIRIAYEALSWGRHVNECPQAWDLVERPTAPTSAWRSTRSTSSRTETELGGCWTASTRGKVFLVQLSDFMWQASALAEERIETARHFRVFPGEGVHGDADRRAGRGASTRWATGATTASRSSTTTTASFRCRWWRNVRADPSTGSGVWSRGAPCRHGCAHRASGQ